MKYTLLSIAFFLAAWNVTCFFTPSIILPSPGMVWNSFLEQLLSGEIPESLATTALRVFSGFIGGLAVGSLLGFAAGLSRKLYRFTRPYIAMMQSVPRLSWILIATFWFGLTPSVVVFLVGVTVLPFFYVNVSESVRYTDKHMLEVARVYRMSFISRFTDILLPSAAGSIMAASSVSLSVSWKAVIMAELLSVPDGIGAQMSVAQSNIDMSAILAYTIVVALIAWGSNALMTFIFDRYFKRWKA